MIRRHLVPTALQGEKYFRWRGGDVSRIEGLTDAVFAISLTLLVVSLQVPATFREMASAFLQLPAFAICFALLMMCWWYHYQYHRRYGFEDLPTVFLNSVLLFLIMFYVYPLKFLFTLLVDGVRGIEFGEVVLADGTAQPVIVGSEMPTLMLLYSGGFAGIFLVYTVMYVRAYRLREALGLNPVEVLITRTYIRVHLISVGIAALSIGIVLVAPAWTPLAGLVYFLMGPVHGLHGWLAGRRTELLWRETEADEDPPSRVSDG